MTLTTGCVQLRDEQSSSYTKLSWDLLFKLWPTQADAATTAQPNTTTTITEITRKTSSDNDVEQYALVTHHPNVDGNIPCELLSQDPLWPDAVSTFAETDGNEPATTYNMAFPTHNVKTAVHLPASGGKCAAIQLTSNVHRITSDGENMRAWWSKMVETTSRRATEANAILTAE